jgi:hypothetical protein
MQGYMAGQQTRKGALRVRFADGITQVHVPATDLESAVVWYVTRLGCDLVDYQPGHALLRVPGGPHLVLWVSNAVARAPRLANGAPCAALRLQVHDLATFSAYLHVAHCAMEQQSDQTTGDRVLRLHDPSGNMLLIQEQPAADRRSALPAAAMVASRKSHPSGSGGAESTAVQCAVWRQAA